MFFLKAPYPRFRIYADPGSYLSFFKDLILGRIKKGKDVGILEQSLAEKFNVSDVACVSMARVGIYLTVKNLIKPRQEVIMSPYTIADVVNMVILAGGVPVFADVEKRSCNIDPGKIEELIGENTGAVLVTHLHGIGAPVYKIKEICEKHNLFLIEDAAQAFGAIRQGKRLGTIGDAGVYSFGMYKNINSWYGGAVVSRNKDLIKKIRKELGQYNYQSSLFILKRILKGLLTDIITQPFLFKNFTYWIFRYGFLNDIKWINRFVETELDTSRKRNIPNHYLTRMTPSQARLALLQLNKIDLESALRFEKASLYYKELSNISGLFLPSEPSKEDNSLSIYSTFPVQYKNRKKLLKWLMLNKRDIAAQHLKNCADLPSFSDFYYDCPVARKTADQVIFLPTYPDYPASEVCQNIKVIKNFFKQ